MVESLLGCGTREMRFQRILDGLGQEEVSNDTAIAY